jgi:hypothetical protein
LLSGGDYDGDKLVVCTNPALVSTFDSSRADPSFADPPFTDSDWFDVDRRKVKDVVAPLIAAKDNSALASVFIEGLWQGTQYGVLSAWHTSLSYVLGLDDPLTREVSLFVLFLPLPQLPFSPTCPLLRLPVPFPHFLPLFLTQRLLLAGRSPFLPRPRRSQTRPQVLRVEMARGEGEILRAVPGEAAMGQLRGWEDTA